MIAVGENVQDLPVKDSDPRAVEGDVYVRRKAATLVAIGRRGANIGRNKAKARRKGLQCDTSPIRDRGIPGRRFCISLHLPPRRDPWLAHHVSPH